MYDVTVNFQRFHLAIVVKVMVYDIMMVSVFLSVCNTHPKLGLGYLLGQL
jgi:hypothetical protein